MKTETIKTPKTAAEAMGMALEKWIDDNLDESREETSMRMGICRVTLWRLINGKIKIDFVLIRTVFGREAVDSIISALHAFFDDNGSGP